MLQFLQQYSFNRSFAFSFTRKDILRLKSSLTGFRCLFVFEIELAQE
jgi:hypothetical protein